MRILTLYKLIQKITIFSLVLIFFTSCGGFFERKEPIEPDARKRARQNVEEGRGFSAQGAFKGRKGNTNFEFASSNPLWRATLDTLDFMVISSVDYAGGLIISDWYSENNPNEAIKVTVRFLANEVRVDALDVIIHKKNCQNQNCVVKEIETDLSNDIKDKILKKAAYYVKADKDKIKEKNKGKIKNSERDIY